MKRTHYQFTLEATLIETVPSPDVLAIETVLRRHYANFLEFLRVPVDERLQMIERLYPTTPVSAEEPLGKSSEPELPRVEALSTQARGQGI